MPLQSSGLHLHGTLWMCFVTKGDPINLFLCLGQGISSPCSHTNCYFQRWRIHQELQSQRTGELSETVKQLQAPSPSPHTDPGRAIPNGKGIARDPWVVAEGDFYWVELRQESAKESWTGLQEFFIQTLKKVLSFGQVFWARFFFLHEPIVSAILGECALKRGHWEFEAAELSLPKLCKRKSWGGRIRSLPEA